MESQIDPAAPFAPPRSQPDVVAPGVERRPARALERLRARPRVAGKFLFVGDEKLFVRGVTYGTFPADAAGLQFPAAEQVARDFRAMRSAGFNAVRTYTVPPPFLLDAAARHGLRVMVGIPWEQHVDFLADARCAGSIVQRVTNAVRECREHSAVLCYAIGNEIPAPVVRWRGARAVERFLARLHDAAKSVDPDGLVTYVNYPSTEYLTLPFLDLAGFNVYLESRRDFEAYLARLHNQVGDRPLLMGEIGLDSRRNGELAQAGSLAWQVRSMFAAGCAGGFVFSWTDEWHRGGHDIEDWDFGLTTRERRPKLALRAVRAAMADAPAPAEADSPRVSVVVCTHNGGRTIRSCFDALLEVLYPDFEVIVVDDGSTDGAADDALDYGFRLIRTPNRGLSSARNTGLAAASGEIIAYLDDDARPDPHWLSYLAAAFARSGHAGIGGPNLPPPNDGFVATCVANSPGGPTHVLLTDELAEHIPGCNMAFRAEALRAVGGFDDRFHVAGDDVDLCWRIQERGLTLGFAPTAVVWHQRRSSIRAYWRQQSGYGKAEAMLARKWPERYNVAGHVRWHGRLYGSPLLDALAGYRSRVYHGVWGTAPFQSLYESSPCGVWALALMPEWYLLVGVLAAIGLLGLAWAPLYASLALAAACAAVTLVLAIVGAKRATLARRIYTAGERWALGATIALLHLIQPLARLSGRLGAGLHPWRRLLSAAPVFPRPRLWLRWSERWQGSADWVSCLESSMRHLGTTPMRGGPFDRWDLELHTGPLGGARIKLLVEEHGAGRQLVRVRAWPWLRREGLVACTAVLALMALAAAQGAAVAAFTLGAAGLVLGWLFGGECGTAIDAAQRAVKELGEEARE